MGQFPIRPMFPLCVLRCARLLLFGLWMLNYFPSKPHATTRVTTRKPHANKHTHTRANLLLTPHHHWNLLDVFFLRIFWRSQMKTWRTHTLNQANRDTTHVSWKRAEKRKCCNRTSVVLGSGWERLKCLFGIGLASALGLIENTHTHTQLFRVHLPPPISAGAQRAYNNFKFDGKFHSGFLVSVVFGFFHWI